MTVDILGFLTGKRSCDHVFVFKMLAGTLYIICTKCGEQKEVK